MFENILEAEDLWVLPEIQVLLSVNKFVLQNILETLLLPPFSIPTKCALRLQETRILGSVVKMDWNYKDSSCY